ncbi:MAG TPA: TonB C-terminal domain-containing protein [Longimicrobiales bacterium]|nr:TonB C-terminal domain-containing protein [Longimicrobiales bacterium]
MSSGPLIGGPSVMANAFRPRTGRGPGPAALLGSLIVHAIVIAAALFGGTLVSQRERPEQFKVYRVSIVSPPPQVEGISTPTPPKAAVVEVPKPKPAPEPVTKPVPKPKPVQTKTTTSTPPVARPSNAPVAGRNPKPGSIGGEGLNVQLEGEDFPDPEYLENIIRQLNNYFRWTGAGNLTTEVGFYILRDGSVHGLRTLRKSGTIAFDLAALESVDAAGKRRAFGPLTKEWPRDSLGVSFTFMPPR